MLATAVRRAASLALSKGAEDPREILNIIAKHKVPVPPTDFQSEKASRKRADVKLKARTETEEQTLSWWLNQSDPLDIFESDDAHVEPERKLVLERVQSVIHKNYGATYSVSTFGSVKYGAASAKSDMDLMIIDSKRMGGFDPRKKQLSNIYHIGRLAATLKRAGFSEVTAIPASVPIVKFKDPGTGIHCDLNVNDQPGYWNSVMLRRYATLCPHLPGLLLAIKRWSRPIGLNEPSPKTTGTPISYSSYAYALMTVGFLQHLGLLPNLQDKNTASFWVAFDADKQMVDICQGGIVPRREGTQPFYVVDPFIRVRNVTRNVSKEVFARFQKECGAASTELRERSERSGYVIV